MHRRRTFAISSAICAAGYYVYMWASSALMPTTFDAFVKPAIHRETAQRLHDYVLLRRQLHRTAEAYRTPFAGDARGTDAQEGQRFPL